MKSLWLSVIAILVAAMVVTCYRQPTFKDRWQPVIDHPLHQLGNARQGFCFPGSCRVAMIPAFSEYP